MTDKRFFENQFFFIAGTYKKHGFIVDKTVYEEPQ